MEVPLFRTQEVAGSNPALGSHPCNGSFFKPQCLRIGVQARLSEKFAGLGRCGKMQLFGGYFYEQMQFDH